MSRPGDIIPDLQGSAVLLDVGPERRILRTELSWSFGVPNPTSSENRFLFVAPAPIEIVLAYSCVKGSTPSVDWNIQHASSRTGTGLDVFDGDITITSGTPALAETLLHPKIDTGEAVWFVTTAKSGTVTEIGVTFLAKWRTE